MADKPLISMRSIQKTIITPYSAEQMYALVNDIESYPQFLPWCSDAEVEQATDQALLATVSLSLGRIKQSFTTRNTLQPGRRIDMNLVRGPFKQLSGYWRFEATGDGACEVQFGLRFQFKNKILSLALNKAFEQTVCSFIDAFRTRAIEVYGKQPAPIA